MHNQSISFKQWQFAPFLEIDSKNIDKSFGEEKRKQERKKALYRLQIEILNSFALLQPEAADNKRDIIIEESTVNSLVSYIDNMEANVYQKKKLTQFIIKLLNQSSKNLNWLVRKYPAPPIILHRPHNPSNSSSFKLMSLLSDELKVFESSLINDVIFSRLDNKKDKDDKFYQAKLSWGRLFYSCARYSALLEVASYAELLGEHITIGRFQDHVWITLFDHPDNERPLRRFFPDEVSLILCQDLNKQKYPLPVFNNFKEKKVWAIKAIQTFRTHLAQKRVTCFNEWHSAIYAWHGMTLPPILLRIATGEQKTTAFPEHIWLRLLSNKIVMADKENQSDKKDNWVHLNPAFVSNKPINLKANYDNEYRNITDILKPKRDKHNRPLNRSKGKAINNLVAYQSTLEDAPLIIYALVDWLIHKIKIDNIETISAYRYLTNLGGFLISKLSNTDIISLTAEELSGVYKELFDNSAARNTNRNKLIQLQQFHNHLVLFGVVAIDFRLEEELSGASNANARILTEHEYQQVLSCLIQNEKTFSDKANTIGFILGFRLGLRINEVTHIRIQDVHLPLTDNYDALLESKFAASLKIRSQELNRLKTTHSSRTLPLHLLLTIKEMQLLISYYAERVLTLGGRPRDFLFPSEKINAGPLNSYELSKETVQLMRLVTGDNKVVFHSLRHSFANQFFALICQIKPITPLPNHWFNADQTMSFQGSLTDVIFKHGNHSRCHAYQLMEWLGHYSPEMSLSAYVHWSDYPIRQFLDQYRLLHKKKQNDPQNSIMNNVAIKKIVMSLLKVNDDTYRHMLENNDQNMIIAVAKKLKIKPIIFKSKIWKAKDVEKLDYLEHPLDLHLSDWVRFYKIFEITHDINIATKQYHFDEAYGEKILNSYSLLSEKGNRGGYLRLPMPREVPRTGKEYKSSQSAVKFYSKLNLIFVEPPNNNQINFAEKIFSKLNRLFKINENNIKTCLRYFIKNYRHQGNLVLVDLSNESYLIKELIEKNFSEFNPTVSIVPPQKKLGKKINLGKMKIKFHLVDDPITKRGKEDREKKKENSDEAKTEPLTHHGFRYAMMIFWIAMEAQLFE